MAHQQRSVPATPPESEMLDLTGSRILSTAKKLQELLRNEHCATWEGIGGLAILLHSVLKTCGDDPAKLMASLRRDLERIIAVCHNMENGQ